MEPFLTDNAKVGNKAKIICVGAGYRGCSFISHISKEISVDINFIAIDTDRRSPKHINGVKKIHIDFSFEKYNFTS